MLKFWCKDNIDSYDKDKTFMWKNIFESGGRGSGKTRTAIEFGFYFLLKYQSVRFIIVKPAGTELHDTWKDVKELTSQIPDAKSNETAKDIRLPNGNYIKLYGVNTKFMKSPKVGLSSFINYAVTIVLYDECYTIEPFIIKQFNLSVRSGDDRNHAVCSIYTFNPWFRTNPHVAYFREHLPENERELESKGIQIKKYPDKKAIFIRSNYRWKNFLREDAIKEIEDEKKISYRRWKVVSLGMDGANQGGIFEASLTQIRPLSSNFDNAVLYIGIDWAESTLKQGSKNVAVAIMYDEYFKQIDIVADNLLDNSDLRLDTNTLMIKQIQWASSIAKRYGRQWVEVWVDNASSKSFYRTWSELALQNGINNLVFKPITNEYKVKRVPTQLRIDITSFLLSNKQLGISQEAKNVWESFDGMYYETQNNDPNKWVASHYLSDAFDAYCYALNYNILRMKPNSLFQKSSNPNSAFNFRSKNDWDKENSNEFY